MRARLTVTGQKWVLEQARKSNKTSLLEVDRLIIVHTSSSCLASKPVDPGETFTSTETPRVTVSV